MAEYSCEVSVEGAVRIVHVRGEVDLAVAERLRETLESLLTPGAAVAMDCSGITFLDSTGLRAAVLAANQAQEVGAVFSLIAPSDPVARVLELSGVAGMFTVHADSAQAVLEGSVSLR